MSRHFNLGLGLIAVIAFGCGSSRAGAGADASGSGGDATATDTADSGPYTAPTNWRMLLSYSDSQHGIIYSAGKVYAVHAGGSNLVEVIDADTYATGTQITVGPTPTVLATDGRYVFSANILAVNPGDAYMSVIDTHTDTVVHSGTVSTQDEGLGDNNPTTNFPIDIGVARHAGAGRVPHQRDKPDMLAGYDIGTWTEHAMWNAGSGPGELSSAGGIVALNNDKAIGNPNDDAVELYQPNGTFITELATSGILHWSVAVGSKVFVARELQSGPGQLLVIDPVAETFHALTTEEGPYGVASANGLVYTVCTRGLTVDVFDATTEAQVTSIDLATVAPLVVNPRGIAVSPRGDIYLESDNMISVLTHGAQ